MNKKILALIISAVVVIGGAGTAVAILRKPATQPEETTAAITEEASVTEETGIIEDVSLPEDTSVDDQGNAVVTDAQGQTSVVATIANAAKQIAQTTKSVAASTTAAATSGRFGNRGAAATTTTKAAANNKTTTTTTTKKSSDATAGTGLVDRYVGPEAEQSLLGYRKAPEGYYYCDDKDNWQKGTGYNEVYDKWAPVAAMYIDQVRIRFRYENKNWMIQLWKGQYGYLLIGAEIGVYTCALDEYNGGVGDINHFDVADKEDWLYMQLDCYYCQGGNGQYKKIFTRPYDKYWWATGFVKGQLTKYTAPRTELKTKNRITFKSEEQANIFVQGLKNCGFRRAAGSDQLVDDSYFASGADVWVLWSTLYNDSFVGYGS